MYSRPGRLLAAIALIAATAGRAPGAPTVLQTAGGTSPLGWPYSSFSEGVLDRRGRAVFVASSTAIFERTDALHQRVGAGVVLADGRRIVTVGPPALADDGCVFARAAFRTGGEAIVRACGQTVTVVVDGGTALAGGGIVRAFVPDVVVRGTDVVGCIATLDDGTTVVLRRDGGGLIEIARSGAPAPTGGTFASFRLLGVPTSGNVGFRATVSNGPDGLFSGRPGGVVPVVVTGDGTPAGGSFADIGVGSINASDHWAFRASVSTGESGIFTADASPVDPRLGVLVRENATTPFKGATIRGFASSIAPSINASDAVAFRALLENGPDGAGSASFLAAPDGTLAALVRTRLDVGGMHLINRLRDPVLADDGTAVIPVGVLGEGSVLYVGNGGPLTPLARLGDPTDTDNGDSRFHFASPSVRATASGAVMLGERDAIFRAETDGTVQALAYAGGSTPLHGRFATLGSPVIDGRDTVYFGAEVQDAPVNEGLFVATDAGPATFLSPARRLLGGGGIRELFPTGVDTLAHPAAAAKGVVLSAALQGARSAEAVFAFRTKARPRLVARSGGFASGQRLAAFGTPASGGGGTVAMLVLLGRTTLQTGLVLRKGAGLRVVTAVSASTRTRVGGVFGELGPPAMARRGAVFRGVLRNDNVEGIFIGTPGRTGVLAATGDTTLDGTIVRTVDDPVAIGDDVYFLARVAGGVSSVGLFRVHAATIPKRDDAPLPIEPVLRPGDAMPSPVGGVVVGIATPRVGPGNNLTVVVDVSGGGAPSALLALP